MKVTVELDDDVFRRALRCAIRSGSTPSEVVENALRHLLTNQQAECRLARPITTSPGKLRAGIVLDDNASLLDVMDNLS